MWKSKEPTFGRERRLLADGYNVVIGVDEVGRGALAGPVVAGAVAFKKGQILKRSDLFKKSPLLNEVDDSKRLTAKKREELAKIIKKEAKWGIGEVGVATINRVGIVKATEKAMRLALRQAQGKQQDKKVFVLVDAFHVKYIPGVGLKNEEGIIKGDQKVLSIAAASIVAKVYRDKLMSRQSRYNKHDRYGWKRNKGYGTAEHLRAIRKFGLSRFHRLQFCSDLV